MESLHQQLAKHQPDLRGCGAPWYSGANRIPVRIVIGASHLPRLEAVRLDRHPRDCRVVAGVHAGIVRARSAGTSGAMEVPYDSTGSRYTVILRGWRRFLHGRHVERRDLRQRGTDENQQENGDLHNKDDVAARRNAGKCGADAPSVLTLPPTNADPIRGPRKYLR
jgi:hypothetical protein